MKELLQRIKDLAGDHFGGNGFRGKVLRGSVWLGIGSSSEQVTRFVRNIALTHLIAPNAFGAMALVTAACYVLHTIMDFGVRDALVQNPKGGNEEYVGAAWWMTFTRAIAFCTVMFSAAPLIARFYGNPDLRSLFRIAAISVLIDGLLSAKAYVAIKEMSFRNWAIINHGGAICGVLFTIGLSFYLRNVWALAFGSCAESLGRTIVSYVVCPYLPPLACARSPLRDLLTFSRKAFGLSLLNLIFLRADIFVLGRLYSPTDLGLYAMAVYLIQTPVNFLVNMLSQTLRPTIAQIQGEKSRINDIVIRVTSMLALATIPVLVFVMFCAKSILTLFYGARYAVAAGPMTVAALTALISLINNQITSVFFSTGEPQLHRRCVAIMAFTVVVLIYPFALYFGLLGGQIAVLLASLAGFCSQLVRIRKRTGLNLELYGKPFLSAAAISLFVASVCLGARMVGASVTPVQNISWGAVGCLLAYLTAFGPLVRSYQQTSTE